MNARRMTADDDARVIADMRDLWERPAREARDQLCQRLQTVFRYTLPRPNKVGSEWEDWFASLPSITDLVSGDFIPVCELRLQRRVEQFLQRWRDVTQALLHMIGKSSRDRASGERKPEDETSSAARDALEQSQDSLTQSARSIRSESCPRVLRLMVIERLAQTHGKLTETIPLEIAHCMVELDRSTLEVPTVQNETAPRSDHVASLIDQLEIDAQLDPVLNSSALAVSQQPSHLTTSIQQSFASLPDGPDKCRISDIMAMTPEALRSELATFQDDEFDSDSYLSIWSLALTRPWDVSELERPSCMGPERERVRSTAETAGASASSSRKRARSESEEPGSFRYGRAC